MYLYSIQLEYFIVGQLSSHFDAASVSKLDGVGQEVEQDLLHSLFICVNNVVALVQVKVGSSQA